MNLDYPTIKAPAFSQTLRRSAPVNTGFTPLSGRWVSLNAAGNAIAAANGAAGNVYLVLEGLIKPSRTATWANAGAGTVNVPSETVRLPSAVAANEIALLGEAGCVVEIDKGGFAGETAEFALGAPLALATHASGAYLVVAGAGVVPVAVVEAKTTTTLTVRLLAQAAVA